MMISQIDCRPALIMRADSVGRGLRDRDLVVFAHLLGFVDGRSERGGELAGLLDGQRLVLG